MNLCELLQSPPLSSPGLRGCLAMLGQGEGKIIPLKGAVRCQHSSAHAGVAVFSTAKAPGVAKSRAGRRVSPAGGSAGTALGRDSDPWGAGVGWDVSSSGLFPLLSDSHPCNSPMASQFTQMLSRFCITEVLFLFKQKAIHKYLFPLLVPGWGYPHGEASVSVQMS